MVSVKKYGDNKQESHQNNNAEIPVELYSGGVAVSRMLHRRKNVLGFWSIWNENGNGNHNIFFKIGVKCN